MTDAPTSLPTTSTRTRAAALAGACLAGALTLAGCTSTSSGTGEPAAAPTPSVATTPAAPSSAPSTPAPPTSAPATTSAGASTAPPSSATPTPTPTKRHHPPQPSTPPATPTDTAPVAPTTTAPPAPVSSSAAAPGNGCALRQLAIQGVRGGAFQGREIAGVLFTNTSAKACTVSGYPSAQLVRNGNLLGRPANDNPGAVHTILLKPGQMAQAQLTAVTTCQAPLSDAVRVSLPGQSDTADTPMQLRACSLSVNPLQRP